MINRVLSFVQWRSSSKLGIGGMYFRVGDFAEDPSAGPDQLTAPLEHLLRTFLRTRGGCRPDADFVRGLDLPHRKHALEGLVKCRSRLLSIPVLGAEEMRCFLNDVRRANTENALDDLAQRFMRRWHKANQLVYEQLKSTAAATTL